MHNSHAPAATRRAAARASVRALSGVTTSATATLLAGVTTINMDPGMARSWTPGWPDHGLKHGPSCMFSHGDVIMYSGRGALHAPWAGWGGLSIV
jgi:hypothetical protein